MSEEVFAEVIEVDQQPIELCKLLKIANLVSGGGEAKIVISQGYVFVNGELELQKRKKIVEGDLVEFNGQYIVIQVVANNHSQQDVVQPSKATTQPKRKKRDESKQKRKAISF